MQSVERVSNRASCIFILRSLGGDRIVGMAGAEYFGGFLDAMPLVRKLWRALLERGLEIEFHSPTWNLDQDDERQTPQEEDKPITVVHVHPANPHIRTWLDCVFINNRVDRKELILSGSLHLKRRSWLFWWKTITQTPIERVVYSRRIERVVYSRRNTKKLNIELEPMSNPTVVGLEASGEIKAPLKKLPRRMRLVVELRMVGPIRRVRRLLSKVKHDPKTVAEADTE